MTGSRVALLFAVAACTALPGASAAATPEEQEMVDALNAGRADRNLPQLRLSPSLERSSFAFAQRLMRTDVFAHAERIQAGGRFRRLGEVLAWTPGLRLRRPRAVRMWLASPGHRALILSRRFHYVGAGRARGIFGGVPATVWVVQLGSL